MPVRRVHLTIAIAATLILAVVIHDVAIHGPLSAYDAAAVAWLDRTPVLTALIIGASLSGGPSSTAVYTAILIVSFLAQRKIASGLAIGLIVYGAELINVAMKHVVQRGRRSPTVRS